MRGEVALWAFEADFKIPPPTYMETTWSLSDTWDGRHG